MLLSHVPPLFWFCHDLFTPVPFVFLHCAGLLLPCSSDDILRLPRWLLLPLCFIHLLHLPGRILLPVVLVHVHRVPRRPVQPVQRVVLLLRVPRGTLTTHAVKIYVFMYTPSPFGTCVIRPLTSSKTKHMTLQGYYCPAAATTYYACPAGYYCPYASAGISACATGTYSGSCEICLVDLELNMRPVMLNSLFTLLITKTVQ